MSGPAPASAAFPCAACGFLAFAEPAGSLATCATCGWIDDLQQLEHPDFIVGANAGRSLREAQAAALARYPLAGARGGGVERAREWRPLHPGEDPAAAGLSASPACALATPERDGYLPYWRRR